MVKYAFMKSLHGLLRNIAFAAVMIAAVWGFHLLLFRHAPDVFRAEHEDMSFGWYVPLFSLYVVWTERWRIKESVGSPSLAGLLFAVPFFFLSFLGARGAQVRLEIVGFAGFLVAAVWAFYGRRTASRIVFPAAFLLFCMPLATFLDIITVHLRIFASSAACGILYAFGADVVRQGTMIAAADGSFAIDVAEPCSGLRSIFALAALTAGYAYFSQPTWTRRAVLFAAAVPIAVIGNIVRILSICAVATYASSGFATGFYHDYSGYVVFAAAIALMIMTGEAVSALARKHAAKAAGGTESHGGNSAAAEPPDVARSPKPLLAVSIAAVFVAALFWQASEPETVLCEAPAVTLPEIPGWTHEDLPPSEAETEMLPDDTIIKKRRYTASDGEWFVATVVIGGTSKSSIHRPELCLPAQGWRMENPRTATVGDVEWRRLAISRGTGLPIGFMYTFYNQAGYATASHVKRIWRDVLDRSFLSRIDRWVMVTVSSSVASDAALETAGRLLEKHGVVGRGKR